MFTLSWTTQLPLVYVRVHLIMFIFGVLSNCQKLWIAQHVGHNVHIFSIWKFSLYSIFGSLSPFSAFTVCPFLLILAWLEFDPWTLGKLSLCSLPSMYIVTILHFFSLPTKVILYHIIYFFLLSSFIIAFFYSLLLFAYFFLPTKKKIKKWNSRHWVFFLAGCLQLSRLPAVSFRRAWSSSLVPCTTANKQCSVPYELKRYAEAILITIKFCWRTVAAAAITGVVRTWYKSRS